MRLDLRQPPARPPAALQGAHADLTWPCCWACTVNDLADLLSKLPCAVLARCDCAQATAVRMQCTGRSYASSYVLFYHAGTQLSSKRAVPTASCNPLHPHPAVACCAQAAESACVQTAGRVLQHMLRAHAAAYRAIREMEGASCHISGLLAPCLAHMQLSSLSGSLSVLG